MSNDSGFSLLPAHPESWAQYPFERLFALDRQDREPLQLAALQLRFAKLKDTVPALQRLATRQRVTQIDSVVDALPLFFNHLVYKSYPLALIETRDFPRLTAWLNRLTLHDLTKMNLDGLATLDDWLDRLDSYGMLIGHSTGTSGKLSFVPRSRVEWAAWQAAYHDATRASTGVDPKTDFVPTFFPGYRGGHHMMLRMQTLFMIPASGGAQEYHSLYQSAVSSDLMSLAVRLQSAEDKGEMQRLGLDPALLAKRDEMIAQARRRPEELEAWFAKLIAQYRGRRVRICGTASDLLRVALSGQAKGLRCDFAAESFILSGGGMKGYKDPPADWEDQIKQFFGVDRICGGFGMSENMGMAPLCSHGFYHFRPFTIPLLLDSQMRALPRTGVQTGRLALFDLLPETYWGGFITGDQVTMRWDEDCACGWKGPRLEKAISRIADAESGDEKISCAGSAQAYNEFMDFVAQV
jgi:hypothetical protein